MLIDEYKALSARNDFFLDAEQEKAINKFQELYNKIIGLKGSSNSILGNIGLNLFNSSSKKTGKGIYLHGGVGIGKTFIMDMFYKELPINNKKRITNAGSFFNCSIPFQYVFFPSLIFNNGILNIQVHQCLQLLKVP